MSTVPFSRQRKTPLDTDKPLPNNLDAERSVLGAILLDNRAIAELTGYLHPDDFFLDQNKRIFIQMLELARIETGSGRALATAIDLVTLTESLHTSGNLEAAGGAPYLASLADGMPKVSNVKHYAKIVKDLAVRRALIHQCHNIQMRAFEGEESPEALLSTAELRIKELVTPSTNDNPIVCVSYKELLTLDLPKADPLIDPLVTRAGTFMLYSWSGWGKSWIATEMAFCMAQGSKIIFNGHQGAGGHWPMFGPVRTLYMYGEMHGEKIRQRLKMIAKAHRTNETFDDLAVVSKDYQRIARATRAAQSWRPSVSTPSDRKFVEDLLFGEGYFFLVLDNISTLWSASREEESKQVATLKDWFIDLNSRGITVFFLQHAGKGGDFLGDSAQVHILDSYLKLEHPGDYRRSQGLRVIVNVEKNREFGEAGWTVPFEAQLVVTEDHGAQWLTRPATAAQKKVAFEMFANGAPATEVLRHLSPTGKELHRTTLYRWQREFKNNQSSEVRDEDE
jgi:hypothetical protein